MPRRSQLLRADAHPFSQGTAGNCADQDDYGGVALGGVNGRKVQAAALRAAGRWAGTRCWATGGCAAARADVGEKAHWAERDKPADQSIASAEPEPAEQIVAVRKLLQAG